MLANGVALRCIPGIILPGRVTPNTRLPVIIYGEERNQTPTAYADLRTRSRPLSEDGSGRRRDDSFREPADGKQHVRDHTNPKALFDA
ncbi:hypothetical protein GCM10022206_82120 [Streptomyces chiangmaiensis]